MGETLRTPVVSERRCEVRTKILIAIGLLHLLGIGVGVSALSHNWILLAACVASGCNLIHGISKVLKENRT